MIGRRIAFLVLLMLSGCAGAAVRSVQQDTASDEVVVGPAQWTGGVQLRVGNTLRVPVPARQERWTVVTPRNILRLLTTPDRGEQPERDGWRFEAVAPGSGSITFTGVPFRQPQDPDQPNPPKFTLQVTVQ